MGAAFAAPIFILLIHHSLKIDSGITGLSWKLYFNNTFANDIKFLHKFD